MKHHHELGDTVIVNISGDWVPGEVSETSPTAVGVRLTRCGTWRMFYESDEVRPVYVAGDVIEVMMWGFGWVFAVFKGPTPNGLAARCIRGGEPGEWQWRDTRPCREIKGAPMTAAARELCIGQAVMVLKGPHADSVAVDIEDARKPILSVHDALDQLVEALGKWPLDGLSGGVQSWITHAWNDGNNAMSNGEEMPTLSALVYRLTPLRPTWTLDVCDAINAAERALVPLVPVPLLTRPLGESGRVTEVHAVGVDGCQRVTVRWGTRPDEPPSADDTTREVLVRAPFKVHNMCTPTHHATPEYVCKRCGGPAYVSLLEIECVRVGGCARPGERMPAHVRLTAMVTHLGHIEELWRAAGDGVDVVHPTEAGAIAAWRAKVGVR